MKSLKKVLFGGLAALVLAAGISCKNSVITPKDQLNNKPPNIPTISGPTSGYAGRSYTFTAKTEDPEGDSVAYKFDWEDNASNWTEIVTSGTPKSLSHTYSNEGVYKIRVRANDINGQSSKWSNSHQILIEEDPLPPDVPRKHGYCNYPTLPEGYSYGNAQLAAFYDDRKPGTSILEIDYLRFYARVNGKDTLLASDEYNSPDSVCGGIFKRYPKWFYNNESEPLPPIEIKNGCAILPISDQPDKIWHLWSCKKPRAKIPENAILCYVETRERVIGDGRGFVGIGKDYWPDSLYTQKNNIEGGFSDWYSGSEWQIIKVCYKK